MKYGIKNVKNYKNSITVAVAAAMLIILITHKAFAMDNLDWDFVKGKIDYIGIASNSSVCVIVGTNGRILSSGNGVDWLPEKSGTDVDINDIVWDGREFIAVGNKGVILDSEDGKAWTVRKSGIIFDLHRVIWNGKLFVAVGGDPDKGRNSIITSDDGKTWIERSSPEPGVISSIAYNGKFIALGQNMMKYFAIESQDGISWKKSVVSIPESIYDDIVTYKGNFYLSCYPLIYSSKDGIEWKPALKEAYNRPHMFAVNNFLLAAGWSEINVHTEDGATWVEGEPDGLAANTEAPFSPVFTFFKGKYIGAGCNGTVVTSPDLKAWEEQGIDYNLNLRSAASNGFLTVAVGGNYAYRSKDGWNWEECTITTGKSLGSTALESTTWDGRQFLVLNENQRDGSGEIYASPDGVKWDMVSSLKGNGFQRIFYTDSKYFIIKDNKILSSEDLKAWTETSLNNSRNITDMAANGTTIAAVGYGGTILTSEDGKTWTKRNSNTSNDLKDIIWDGSQFVAVGEKKTVAKSADGVNWTAKAEDTLLEIASIIWDGSGYLATSGYSGEKLTYSKDLESWYDLNPPGNESTVMLWDGFRYISLGRSIMTAVPRDIIKVVVDGRPIAFDAAPVTRNDRTLVPARLIFEALGARVQWEGKTRTVTASDNSTNLSFRINEQTAVVNGKEIKLDTPAISIKGRTLVPLRFISESFGAEVDWDKETNTVKIKAKKK